MFNCVTKTIAAALFFTVSVPTNAATYLFTLTGSDTASFTLDTSTGVVQNVGGGVDALEFYGIPGVLNGVDGTIRVDFFASADLGGFQFSPITPRTNPPTPYAGAEGIQVFTGSLSSPIFTTGTFLFTTGATGGPVNDTLVISDPQVRAVPEPATWAMMLIGFVGLGFALRGKRFPRLKAA